MASVTERFESSLNLDTPEFNEPIYFGPAGKAEFRNLDFDPLGSRAAYAFLGERRKYVICVIAENDGGKGEFILKEPATYVSFRMFIDGLYRPSPHKVLVTFKDEKGAVLDEIAIPEPYDDPFDNLLRPKAGLAGKIKSIVVEQQDPDGTDAIVSQFFMDV